MLSKRERRLLAVLLLLVLAVAGWTAVGQVRMQLQIRRNRLVAARQHTAIYRRTIAQAESIADTLSRLTRLQETMLPQSNTWSDPYAFGVAVDAVFDRFAITVRRYRILEQQQDSRPGVQAELAGTLPELLRLLQFIETDQPLWHIDNLVITDSGAPAGQHHMTIRIAYAVQ